MNHRFLPFLLRFSAGVIALIAIVLFIVQMYDARLAATTIDWPHLIFPPIITIALALVLAGVANSIGYSKESPAELARSISRMQQNLADLQHRVDEVANNTERIARKTTAPPAPPPPPIITAHIPDDAFDPVLKAIAEVRELALLTDAERGDRLSQMEQERKIMLVRNVIEHMEKNRWAEGAALLDTLDREHPGDLEIKRTRNHFDDARRNAEIATVTRVREQIDNYIAIGAWEQAVQAATRLSNDFPTNTEGTRILTRVTRERDIHVESSVARMVEEIRHDIDRRLWRRALMHAQRLVERFGEHPKTQKILEQLGTLQQNAEIEERQELEVRIQELIRSHQFQPAIELSEEMLQRFPDSPQAEAIDSLLPRIKQLAAEAEEPAAS